MSEFGMESGYLDKVLVSSPARGIFALAKSLLSLDKGLILNWKGNHLHRVKQFRFWKTTMNF